MVLEEKKLEILQKILDKNDYVRGIQADWTGRGIIASGNGYEFRGVF